MTNRGLRNNPRFNKIQPYHAFCIRFIHLLFLRQVANPLWLVYPISLLVFSSTYMESKAHPVNKACKGS